MESIGISIIVPVYNVANLLSRCANSLQMPCDAGCEIILVDDGSTDGSGALCDRIAQKDAHVRVIHKPNGGLSDTRNAGIGIARGEYLTFVDSDDFVAPHYLDKMFNIARENGCDVVQCGYKKGSMGIFSGEGDKSPVYVCTGREALAGSILRSSAWAKLYRSTLFSNLRFPVGYLNEDEFVIWKTVYLAGKIAFTDEKLYYYYQRPDSIMSRITGGNRCDAALTDWMAAYDERIAFFLQHNEDGLAARTHEKYCIDLLLRYCEQKNARRANRLNREELKRMAMLFLQHMRPALESPNMCMKRKCLYRVFTKCPDSIALMARLKPLRK